MAREIVASSGHLRGWHTSDAEEVEQRRRRGAEEEFSFVSLEPRHRRFGTFRVSSVDGGTYDVEIRSLTERSNSCGCPDHRVNGLGTCKHVEAVLRHLQATDDKGLERAVKDGSGRVEIFLDTTAEEPQIRIGWPRHAHPELRSLLHGYFTEDGAALSDPSAAIPALARHVELAPTEQRRRIRLSTHLLAWAEERARRVGRQHAREEFVAEVASGRRSLDLARQPLYPYQQEGVVFLAFTERALLGDEMGLGKTVQAIAACELLRRLRGVERVLVVSPVSLKAEWEEQIAKFTGLPTRIIAGARAARLRQYREPSFFYLSNYEQVVADGPDINRLIAPDVVIVDEAQRIKNWRTKTARSVKRLESRYAFVLTGTPLENRIDDLYSIVQFLDPAILGPLFRFNLAFYELDERGRPIGYRNLAELHRRLAPVVLRRRKDEVEDQLPARTVNTYVVPMAPEQTIRYEDYSSRVARILARARRRPLSAEEYEKLQRWLSCMRMLCDTPYILDPECRICPKLGELEEILRECLAEGGRKILIFSEWERMLDLVRELAEKLGVSFAWHTGSVPQLRRRDEIRRFKDDPACRLFISTDSGGVGLNLQAASVVINLDLPWNPARLEQRIARAWRKHQHRSVQVINLVTDDSIEQRMLHVLAAKRELAEGLLDRGGEPDELPMPSGRGAFIERLQEVMGVPAVAPPAAATATTPADPTERLGQDLVAGIGEGLLLLEAHATPDGGTTVLAVIDGPPDAASLRSRLEPILRDHAADDGELPRLELLDRATFETIDQLAAAGVLRIASEDRRVLHRSPALVDRVAAAREQRLRRARQAFDHGERKQRMAAVLAGGGFPLEALPSLAEALEAALACLAHLAGLPVEDGDDVSAIDIEWLGRAAPPLGDLASEALRLATACREHLSGDGPGSEEQARASISQGRRIFVRIEDSLARDGLVAAAAD